jgi:hypothetical protein
VGRVAGDRLGGGAVAVLRCVRVYGVSAAQTVETSPLTSNGNWPWETTTVPDGNRWAGMPEYEFGGQLVRRKNLYMPCAVGPRFDDATPEEHVRILKETYWADFVTNNEWPALLGEDGCSPSARSRLKKKAAGWAIVLGRMAVLNPELLAEVLERACGEYERLTESPYPRVALSAEVVFPATHKPSPEWASN